MRLDPDCIRELLIAVEETTYFTENLEPVFSSIDEIHELSYMKKYSMAEIAYTAKRLDEAELLNVDIHYADNKIYCCYFNSLTYQGHKYLDSIRTPDIWIAVKKYISQVGGSVALPIAVSIAEKVIAQKLGLTP